METKNIQEIINELKQSTDKEDCLHRAYNILTKKYQGSRLKTITKLHYLLISDINDLWQKNGFLHCTKLNQLLRFFLIQSGFFDKKDIQYKWTSTWLISPHQYVQIRINKNKFINIDIWGHAKGIKFGNYAHGIY